MRILFDSKNTEYKSPFGPVRRGEKCTFNVHIPTECGTENVSLALYDDTLSPVSLYEAKLVREYGGYGIYSCTLAREKCGLYFYNFRIRTVREEFEIYKEGCDRTNIGKGEMWQISVIPEDYAVPEIYAGRIMYQIFPDRFNRAGEVCLDGKITPYTVHKSTRELPEPSPAGTEPKNKNTDFYGGNLRGIEEKLPYIKSLGASVIYLNPIFKAHSNHRYDTADYLKIDEMLGDEEDFRSLCESAHGMDMKIILDGVFSHTGAESVYFDIDGKFGGGAYNNENSPYRSWYKLVGGGTGYESWWGVPTLPCTEETSPKFQSFIFDRVLPKWFGLGADGIRLDVADELPDSFIKKLRARVKELKRDALVIGEVWEDASNKISYGERRKYFTDGELDSVMNYPFRNAIIGFVNGDISGDDFKDFVMTVAENYPGDVLRSVMNMLSTHDTPRILTVLKNASVREGKSPEEAHADAIKKLSLAVSMQFILPGMPCIYYGDENGTEGEGDPYCRSYFDWDREKCIVDVYKDMAVLRGKYDVLSYGDVRVSDSYDGSVTVTREYNGRTLRATYTTVGIPYMPAHGELVYSVGYGNGRLEKYGIVITVSEK